MAEGNAGKKLVNNWLILLVLLSLFMGLYSIFSTLTWIEKNDTIKELTTKTIGLKSRINTQDVFLQEQSSKRQEAENELESIKKRIENIKTLDDLLERDIKLYIKTKYKKVPRSVASEIAQHTMIFGKKYNISPVLLVGIMQVESGFNPMITGQKTKYGNARGLMQVMPEWVKKMDLNDVYDLYDIDTNIETGCKVWLIHLEEANGSISKSLFKYVNGDKKYEDDVFKAMGKFIAFRSTVDDKKSGGANEEEEENGNEDKPPTKEEDKEPKK